MCCGLKCQFYNPMRRHQMFVEKIRGTAGSTPKESQKPINCFL